MFSVSITHNSKIRELSDGNKKLEIELCVAKRTSQLWIPPFLSYELWKQSYGNYSSKQPLTYCTWISEWCLVMHLWLLESYKCVEEYSVPDTVPLVDFNFAEDKVTLINQCFECLCVRETWPECYHTPAN